MPSHHVPTLRDVARQAGVSVSTVSNYLRDYPYMSEKTRDRIANAINYLGYVRNEQASSLRSGKTHNITLCVPDLRQPYFGRIAEQIMAAARYRGYSVIVKSSTYSRREELEVLSQMGSHASDGLIFNPVAMTEADVRAFSGDYPLVILGERIFTAPAPHIEIDNTGGARAMVRHLLASGRRKIAVLGGSLEKQATSSRSLRTQGFLDEMHAQGVSVDPSLIIPCSSWTLSEGLRATKELFESGARPDAIFALNDPLAIGAMSELKVMGVSIPDDVHVVGFDNSDDSEYFNPTLTTVDPHSQEIATRAVDSLISQVYSGVRAPHRHEVVESSLVFRESSPATDAEMTDQHATAGKA